MFYRGEGITNFVCNLWVAPFALNLLRWHDWNYKLDHFYWIWTWSLVILSARRMSSSIKSSLTFSSDVGDLPVAVLRRFLLYSSSVVLVFASTLTTNFFSPTLKSCKSRMALRACSGLAYSQKPNPWSLPVAPWENKHIFLIGQGWSWVNNYLIGLWIPDVKVGHGKITTT